MFNSTRLDDLLNNSNIRGFEPLLPPYCHRTNRLSSGSVLSTTPNILQIRQNLKVISKRIPYSFVWRTNFLFIKSLNILFLPTCGDEENRTLPRTLQRSIASLGTCTPILEFLVRLENSNKPGVLSGGPNGIRTRTSDVTGRRL